MKIIILFIFYISILVGQIVHEHTHEHNNEFGVGLGIVPEHDGNNETNFTQHFEFYYEFELEKFHIGPQFDIGFEDDDIHYMIGIHLGVDFEF